jgi:Flp pilus assembly protein TadG
MIEQSAQTVANSIPAGWHWRLARQCARSRRAQKTLAGRGAAARRGVAAVEAAIVLSVFLLILFVMLDLGLMVLDYNLLCDGAQQFCRQAIVHGSKSAPQETMWGPSTVQGNAGDGSQYSQSFQQDLTTLPLAKVNYKLEWPNGTNQPDDPVQATLTYQYSPMIPFVLGNKPISLEAVCTMAVDH